MGVPVRPALPGLAGLQALLERQRTVLQNGQPDDLPALSAQLQLQMVQIKSTAAQLKPPVDDAAIAELNALNRLASANLEVLQRRMAANHAALEALGAGSATLAAARQRETYEADGALGAGALGGRMLGQA